MGWTGLRRFCSTNRISAVRWEVAANLVAAWVLASACDKRLQPSSIRKNRRRQQLSSLTFLVRIFGQIDRIKKEDVLSSNPTFGYS